MESISCNFGHSLIFFHLCWDLAIANGVEHSLLCIDELCFQNRWKGIRGVTLFAFYSASNGCCKLSAILPILSSIACSISICVSRKLVLAILFR